jgi:hypothetical protein
MARDHARIRLDIWADDDFRELPGLAQWLYLHLLTSPALSFCGVTDWRPARIAARTAELTAHDVEVFAGALEEGLYVVVDRDSEEVLIRSFIKHDGLMKSPNMAKAMATAHAGTASAVLRAVVVGQLIRLEENDPGLKGWQHVPGLLRKRSMTPEEAIATLPPNPSVKPSTIPSVNPSDTTSGDPSATPFLPSSLTPDSLPSVQKVSLLSHQGENA